MAKKRTMNPFVIGVIVACTLAIIAVGVYFTIQFADVLWSYGDRVMAGEIADWKQHPEYVVIMGICIVLAVCVIIWAAIILSRQARRKR